MLSFFHYLTEVALSGSGKSAEYHASKYLDPYIGGGKEGIEHTLASDTKIGDKTHPAGTKITIHSTKDENGNRITGSGGRFQSIVSVDGGPKHPISNSKIKKPNLGNPNALNTHFANAFEAHTALELHRRSGSASNTNPEYLSRIASIKKQRDESLTRLPEHMKNESIRLGDDAATSYLQSLRENHKINPEDIHEVYLTNKGISSVIGRTVSRRANPHDIMIKTKSGKVHGASLKAREGTISNNGLKAFDEHSIFNGQHTNLKSAWEGQSNGEAAAKYHGDAFNSGSIEEKKAHLNYLFKAHPDVPYDLVNAEKSSSIPIEEHPIILATKNATSIDSQVRGSKVHFYDQDGKHLGMVEHRRPGPNRSLQANAKFGKI